MRRTPIRSIVVIGRQFFSKRSGRRVFTARVYVNGLQRAKVRKRDGAGEFVEFAAIDLLCACSARAEKIFHNVRQTTPQARCRALGIAYSCELITVGRAKDL